MRIAWNRDKIRILESVRKSTLSGYLGRVYAVRCVWKESD